jgi:hypothetical protein
VVGFADRISPTLWIHAYYGRPVPDTVGLCFRNLYPEEQSSQGWSQERGLALSAWRSGREVDSES